MKLLFPILGLLIVLTGCTAAVGGEASAVAEGADSMSCSGQSLDPASCVTDSVVAALRKELRDYAAARFSGERAADTVYFNEDFIVDKLMWLNKILKDNASSKYIGSIRKMFDTEDVTMLCSAYKHPRIDPAKVVRPVIRLKLRGNDSLAYIAGITDSISYGCCFFEERAIFKSHSDTAMLVFMREDGVAKGYKYKPYGSKWLIFNDDFKTVYHPAIFIPEIDCPLR